ncbi:hypothetical protein G9A89_018691 [Geosiphon pyriformis]|nr:hypothetical protein G9A89_018691 [Geosiphon pyriformis]
MLQDATVQTMDKLVENLWHCKIVSIDCLDLLQTSIKSSQVSGDCFSFPLFDSNKSVGQVIDTIIITEISQELQFEFLKVEFENCKEESELESKKTSEKTSTKPVTKTSSQSRNQKTHDQEEKPDISEATFRDAQGNIISPPLRPINSPAENNNKMATPYIMQLTDFSEEEKETDVYTWLREAQKTI